MKVYSPDRRALAYVNWGRWVADCPDGCNSAERLQPGQDAFLCSNCGQVALVTWPPDAGEIFTVLEMRVMPHRRNWFPRGHPLALASGAPHGQTPADLMAETLAHEDDADVVAAQLETDQSARGLGTDAVVEQQPEMTPEEIRELLLSKERRTVMAQGGVPPQ